MKYSKGYMWVKHKNDTFALDLTYPSSPYIISIMLSGLEFLGMFTHKIQHRDFHEAAKGQGR